MYTYFDSLKLEIVRKVFKIDNFSDNLDISLGKSKSFLSNYLQKLK